MKRSSYTILVITMVLAIGFIVQPGAARGANDELSVVDATELADLIVRNDTIHFTGHVQTEGAIKYSQVVKNGTHLILSDQTNTTAYVYQFRKNLTEQPYNNFFRLHLYLDTGNLSEGDWYYSYHVELENGTSVNTTVEKFFLRDSDTMPEVLDHTEEKFSTRDSVFISARIVDPDGDTIKNVSVEINDTTYELEEEGNVYSKDVGKIQGEVDHFSYLIWTGRKTDGDTPHIYRKRFQITIEESAPENITPPETEDLTFLPQRIRPDSQLVFKIRYRSTEGIPPERMMLKLINVTTGELRLEKALLTEGGVYEEGVIYQLNVDLSGLDITPGLWRYKITYKFNDSDYIVVVKNFRVESKPATIPAPRDLTDIPRTLDGDEMIEFIVEWDHDEPLTEIEVKIYDKESGEELIKRHMTLSSSGPVKVYTVGIDLSELEISDKGFEYNFGYSSQGIEGETAKFSSPSFEGGAEDGNPVVIVIVVLVTIIVLLTLFVFTFGKREPY